MRTATQTASEIGAVKHRQGSGNLPSLLDAVAVKVRALPRTGELASYIPELRRIDPGKFGIAMVTLDGAEYLTGDAAEAFSIQSISKVFALVLAYRLVGNALWERTGRWPSSNRFNSLIELELEKGKPRNPFLNPGALVVTDLLASRNTQPERATLELVRRLSGNASLDYDLSVSAGEFRVANRNKAAAYLMKSFGNFHNEVDDVVAAYCSQCAIAATCVDLARSSLFLANGGVDPATGDQILEPRQTHEVCALMMSSGTYEASGETAFSIGLPVKSGVGGGVLAVVPGFGAICAWSPRLDAAGTSVAGLKGVQFVADGLGINVFQY